MVNSLTLTSISSALVADAASGANLAIEHPLVNFTDASFPLEQILSPDMDYQAFWKFSDSVLREMAEHQPLFVEDVVAVLKAQRASGFTAGVQSLTSIHYSPHMYVGNFMVRPIEYTAIEIAMRLLFPNGVNVAGAQIACNYGPYVHYLREVRGFTRFQGLEKDAFAFQYANDNGVPVVHASSTEMPFADRSLDIIVSKHFLDPSYLHYVGYSETESVEFMLKTVQEVKRCLKKNGIFLSYMEFIKDVGIHTLGNPFTFASERHLLNELAVYVKRD